MPIETPRRKADREREAVLALCSRALLWGPGALNMTTAEIEVTIQHLESRVALLRWALQQQQAKTGRE